MGRRKLNMEFITNEKSRNSIYKERKKGLLKKAEEFSILCDVKTVVIIFGPKSEDVAMEPETFPADSSQVRNIINKYKDQGSNISNKRTSDLSNYFISRKKMVDAETAKLHKAKLEAGFPSTWEDHLNNISVDQLRVLKEKFDKKLQTAKSKLMIMEVNQIRMKDPKSGILCDSDTQHNLNLGNHMDLEFNNDQSLSTYMQPLDMQAPAYGSSSQAVQMPSCDLNPVADPMTMLTMNGNGYTQYDGGVSRSNIPYTQLMPPVNYGPTDGLLEDVVYNSRSVPLCYYGPTMQQMMPNSASHRINVHSFIEFYPKIKDASKDKEEAFGHEEY